MTVGACLRQMLVRRTKGFLQARLQRPFRPPDPTVHRTARPRAPRASSASGNAAKSAHLSRQSPLGVGGLGIPD
jgi:hypothetical protein